MAQSSAIQENLTKSLAAGTTAWITTVDGREEQIRIVGLSASVITAETADGRREFSKPDVTRIEVRHFDSLWNGALIGAGIAVAGGLALCSLTEPWENCRDDVGPMIRIGALGAGIGMGIDALIRGRKAIYEAPHGTVSMRAVPLVGRRSGGVAFSLIF